MSVGARRRCRRASIHRRHRRRRRSSSAGSNAGDGTASRRSVSSSNSGRGPSLVQEMVLQDVLLVCGRGDDGETEKMPRMRYGGCGSDNGIYKPAMR